MPARPRRRIASLLLVLTFTLAACQAGSAASPADTPPVRGVTTVDAKDLKFLPGDRGPAGHGGHLAVRRRLGPPQRQGGRFASETQSRGTFSHRFERAGDYRYTCDLHAGMDGRVVVAGCRG